MALGVSLEYLVYKRGRGLVLSDIRTVRVNLE